MLVFALFFVAGAMYFPSTDNPSQANDLRILAAAMILPGFAIGLPFARWEARRHEGDPSRSTKLTKAALPAIVGASLLLRAAPVIVQSGFLGLVAGACLASAFVAPVRDPRE